MITCQLSYWILIISKTQLKPVINFVLYCLGSWTCYKNCKRVNVYKTLFMGNGGGGEVEWINHTLPYPHYSFCLYHLLSKLSANNTLNEWILLRNRESFFEYYQVIILVGGVIKSNKVRRAL